MTSFFDAFPALNVDEKMYDFFAGTYVEKVSVSKSAKLAFVYCKCDQLLHYRTIKNMENKLDRQIFNQVGVHPKIEVSFPFFDKSSLEKIMQQYDDTLREELRDIDKVGFAIFGKSKINVDENKLIICCDDDFLAHEKSESIIEFYTTRLKKRFDIDVEVSIEYTEKEKVVIEEEPEVYYVERPVDPNEENQGGGENKTEQKQEKKPQKKFTQYKKKPAKDPNVFYGSNVEGEVIPIKEIVDEIGEVVIDGLIRDIEIRELKAEKLLVTFPITDFTDTINIKVFIKKSFAEDIEFFDKISKGKCVRVKGIAAFDSFSKEINVGNINGIKLINDFRVGRVDECSVKRVELHAHTQMSDMDGMTDCKKMVKRAQQWGHPAIAITDHGVVQSFPDAGSAIEKDDFKVIYGCEAYLVDDTDDTVINSKGQKLTDSFVVFDLETTGFSPTRNRIIEIGAVKVEGGEITDRFSTFVNPQIPIPARITELTQITDEMVKDAPLVETALPDFFKFCEGSALVAHNANFDYGFITKKATELGIEFDSTVVDTVGIARVLIPDSRSYTLDAVAKKMKISLINHHRAVEDAEATAEIFEKMITLLSKDGITDLDQLYNRTHSAPEIIKKKPYYHAILLAQNEVGRVNLYRLVSMSHLEYFNRRPRIPKSMLTQWREGIIVGSACEAGELYRALIDEADDDVIEKIVDYYDYLEIQPIMNNKFILEKEKMSEKRRRMYENLNTEADLKDMNRRIVNLGERYNKPVCATCDVHFLDPDDDIYRAIVQAGQGMKDETQPPLYLRTTEEMLEEFAYLGEDKAMEVVVTNTNMIADMIEVISPVYPYKCPPVIEDSDKTLRDICERKAHSMYGEDLPIQVSARLEKELDSIIKNGFAVMYIIAQKLVWKSVEDGYLVGSRGSVGSSFVATMSGITEVNPLPAHYYCDKCHYSDFDSEEVKAYAGSSGFDMPEKNCPKCGAPLVRDGHDIPFETFLGFYGDKEPDIDLNFSGEYQSKAHNYTEVIFGAGQTFRAGTVGTLADKTAFGYVKKYYDEQDIQKRNCEIDRMVEGCVGVRRSTGQHPGGIVVLPMGWNIYTFTPVQHPANDMTTSIITTHFDYHKIDHNLLKLDILGHDDPTMIRMLEDLTGIDATAIPLDDEQVLSLFKDTSALGITPDELMGADLGSLGIPEFGTDFVMQMLKDTKPKNFSDLVRISGLSHGTDVWLNNAQYFIAKGDCTLSTAICTRDDIMTYLIHSGVENGLAFNIMEAVRKGKVAKGAEKRWPEMEKAMADAGVEDWYVESCKRIKYMFPKAHAVAYVMMAFRIAYFKVYYPLAYYAAFFSIRAKAMDYEIMCQGKEKLEEEMKNYNSRAKVKDPTLTPKDHAAYGDMKLVQEMYARGFEFMPIDIYKANSKNFQIIDGKLMPSLNSISGMGDTAAEGVVEAAKDGPFSSCENFKKRSKVSGTIVEKMREMNLLGDMPLSDQMSLLDFMN